MTEIKVQIDRRYIPDTPERMKQRRERIIAILRKYRAYLLTPEDLPLTMELEQLASREGGT